MNRRIMTRAAVSLALAALLPQPLYADCLEGIRPATAAEKRFHVSTLTAVRAALPKAAAGWEMEAPPDIVEPEVDCVGVERAPMILAYAVNYRRVEGMAERVARAEQAVQDASTLPAARQAEADRLQAQFNAVLAKMTAAFAEGRAQEAERLKVEGAALAAKLQALHTGGRRRWKPRNSSFSPTSRCASAWRSTRLS